MLRVVVTGLEYYKPRLAQTPWVIQDAFAQAVTELRPLIKEIIGDVFIDAALAAGEAFPDVYLQSLIRVIDGKIIDTMTGLDSFTLFFDLEELGNYDDLMEGAHFHARLADGSLSEIPYGGQPLANPILKRYLAWLQLDDGTREDTYETRAAYWESLGMAPQWLLLNYGQTLYSPVIHPYPVYENIQARLGEYVMASVEAAIERHFKELWKDNWITARGPEFNKRPGYGYLRRGNRMAGSYKIE